MQCDFIRLEGRQGTVGLGQRVGAASSGRELAGRPWEALAQREEHGAVASGNMTRRPPPGPHPGPLRGKSRNHGRTGGRRKNRHVNAALPPRSIRSQVIKLPLVMHGVRWAKMLSGHALDETSVREPGLGGGGVLEPRAQATPPHPPAPPDVSTRPQARRAGAEPRKRKAGAGVQARGGRPHRNATPRAGLRPHGGGDGSGPTRLHAALREPEREPAPPHRRPAGGGPAPGRWGAPSPARSRCWRPPAAAASPPAR